MYEREPAQLIPNYRPSGGEYWLRGYAHGFKGLPTEVPDDDGAREAYCKGYAAGAAGRVRALKPFFTGTARPAAGP